MKNDNITDDLKPRPFALFAAIAIVLGLLIDRIFFFLAAFIVLIAPLSWLIEWLHKHEGPTTLQRRHI